MQGLERGECEAAASVGVNLTLVHSWTRACLRAGMLSEEGRCKTLDASADGYVRAEGVGSAMLALLDAAQQPSDAVAQTWPSLMLLAGSAVNQDGRSSSLTAPNGPSQQDAMHAALHSGDLAAWQVAHLQMHGTGE
jgi:acyl transferase domain-containing protein